MQTNVNSHLSQLHAFSHILSHSQEGGVTRPVPPPLSIPCDNGTASVDSSISSNSNGSLGGCSSKNEGSTNEGSTNEGGKNEGSTKNGSSSSSNNNRGSVQAGSNSGKGGVSDGG